MSADWADRVVINRRRLGAAGLMSGCLVLGVLSERMAFEWSQPAYWLPDLLTGLIIAGAGVSQLPRRRAVGWLLLAVAVAWFLGGLDSWARYWHRGPLLQLLFTFPIWRPRRRVDAVAVAVGWLVSLTPIIWSTSLGAIALSIGTVLIAGYGMYRAVGGERSYRRAAFLGAVVFGASLLIAVVAGLLLPPDVIAIPALIFYEAGLVAVAVGLARFSPRPATDLVVELAESAPTSPPDALRKALGDRDLELGYWDEAADAYLDRAGRRVAIPEPDEPRQATTITRDQRRFAVLVHDRGVLEDARLADAVRAATQLTESNASLRAIVDEQLTEISASRQRLVIAGDNERAELERRLTVGRCDGSSRFDQPS